MVFLEGYFDKRASNLPYLDSPVQPMIYIVTYLMAIHFGQKYMKSRKPYDLKLLIGAYNIIQIFLCLFIISIALRNGFTLEYIYKCSEGDPSRSEAAMNMLRGCYYTWLLKGLEMVETIIFVLRKKDSQVSFLHVYHHISTFILTWFFARSVGGGMLSFSVVLNSFVHIVMYTYYFLALFGPNMQKKLKWFKKSITTLQIIQFLLLITNGLIASNPSCNSAKWFLAFYMPNIVLLLFMFVKFYSKNYTEKKRA